MPDIITEEPKIEVIHGDCLDVLRTLPEESFDAVVTDPPYSSGGALTTARSAPTRSKYSKSDSVNVPPGFVGDTRDQRGWGGDMWLRECLVLTKPGGLAMVFSDWRQVPTLSDALQSAGWAWKRLFVWDKRNAIPACSGMFRQSCEFVPIGQKGARASSAASDGGWIAPMGSFACSSPNTSHRARLHQTQKPVELLKYLMRIVPPGGRVLDPFVGSGSALVAAHELGMSAVGIEIDGYYARVARDRIDAVRGRVDESAIQQ
jgi:site-specific DNA-methyltransferase (adenine-specific)